MAFEKSWIHRNKHTPWLGSFVLVGENVSAATFKMTFAAQQGGAALITLNNATAGTQGVSAAYDAGYVHPSTGAIVGATTITAQVDEATWEALTFPTAPSPLVLAYDLLFGTPQQPVFYGTFTVYPGVGD